MNMAMELGQYGIRVVTIAPGYTVLPERIQPGNEKLNIWRDSITDRIPLHRFCTPAEVGDAVVFLDSEGARYITGTTLYMDGGALLPVLAENSFIPQEKF